MYMTSFSAHETIKYIEKKQELLKGHTKITG